MPYQYLDHEADQILASGFEYHSYGVIPFTPILTGLESLDPNDIYLVRGSTKIIDQISELTDTSNLPLFDNFKKGIFYSRENFRYSKFSTLDLPLLNKPLGIINTDLLLDTVYDIDLFIKPDSDLKYIPAVVVEKFTTLRHALSNHQLHSKFDQDKCILAKVRDDIIRECRFFIVNNEVVTGSQYQLNRNLNVKPINPKEDILFVAQEYTNLYQPHDNFVIDIATLSDGSYAIIEYNCLNASGLYKSDSKLLFTKLFEYLNASR